MDVTAAARIAKVTTATIRTWCRKGVVAATKTGRKWTIDAASLAYRVNLPSLLRKARKIALTVENIIAVGGRLWEKSGMRRVYLNDWAAFAGLETSHYGTGNIASASYQGEGISNSQAYKIGGSIDKVWFDALDGQLYCRYGYGSPRMTREQVWQDVTTGIRAAIAAL